MENDKKDKKAVESVRKYYNCKGNFHCLYYDNCQFGNGKNTSYDCCECGADDFYAGYMYASTCGKRVVYDLNGDIISLLKSPHVRIATNDECECIFNMLAKEGLKWNLNNNKLTSIN